jgi:hypothetical protein
MITATTAAQVVVALSVLFVWIFRFDNIVREFHEYHLSDFMRTLVGATKIALSTLLLAGVWYPALVLVPALIMAFLMFCAQVAHVRAHHAWQKFVPSLVLLLLSLFIAASASGLVA